MITLGVAKRRLSRSFPDDDETLVEHINFVSEDLLGRLENKETLRRAVFVLSVGTLTLPWNFAGCEGVTSDDRAIRIRNQWWEFLPDGPGIQDSVWSEISDQGDNFVVFKDLADVDEDGCYLKVISDLSENGSPKIHLKGTDTDGEELRWEDTAENEHIYGEKVDINSTGTWSTNKFLSLTQVIKPVTRSRVRIYASATSGAASPTLVATYEPDEENPAWRRYRVPYDTDGAERTIIALCQVRHNWVTNDDAPLPISSMNALESAVRARHAYLQGDFGAYENLMSNALRVLREERRRFSPGNTIQTMIQMLEPGPQTQQLL